jgi:hypothetical protein
MLWNSLTIDDFFVVKLYIYLQLQRYVTYAAVGALFMSTTELYDAILLISRVLVIGKADQLGWDIYASQKEELLY